MPVVRDYTDIDLRQGHPRIVPVDAKGPSEVHTFIHTETNFFTTKGDDLALGHGMCDLHSSVPILMPHSYCSYLVS
jgi:hypothetical protein